MKSWFHHDKIVDFILFLMFCQLAGTKQILICIRICWSKVWNPKDFSLKSGFILIFKEICCNLLKSTCEAGGFQLIWWSISKVRCLRLTVNSKWITLIFRFSWKSAWIYGLGLAPNRKFAMENLHFHAKTLFWLIFSWNQSEEHYFLCFARRAQASPGIYIPGDAVYFLFLFYGQAVRPGLLQLRP